MAQEIWAFEFLLSRLVEQEEYGSKFAKKIEQNNMFMILLI
jgi:hypothetical protein